MSNNIVGMFMVRFFHFLGVRFLRRWYDGILCFNFKRSSFYSNCSIYDNTRKEKI